MRGKEGRFESAHHINRITPAHAGKSRSPSFAPLLAGDHPRACGEKSVIIRQCTHTAGSPPRMRGKEQLPANSRDRVRITPAHAGKRRRRCRRRYRPRDHPRACGEKINSDGSITEDPGSPPRMRGKGTPGSPTVTAAGITPAHAGKRCPRGRPRCRRWDHPRACGEKFVNNDRRIADLGSPPRMRGKVALCSHLRKLPGITPAHAGKRDEELIQFIAAAGSPPRMWGKVHRSAQPCVHRWDHPRACGEKSRG